MSRGSTSLLDYKLPDSDGITLLKHIKEQDPDTLVKQYQIAADPFALEKYRLTIGEVAARIEANNRNAGGALVSTGQQSMVVRGVGSSAAI